MFFKEKSFILLSAMIVILILTACGAGASEENKAVSQDAEATEQDATSPGFIPLSDALEEYSLWFRVEGDPFELTRNSEVRYVFVFEDGEVQQYKAKGLDTIEDLIDMSDEEIIEMVKDSPVSIDPQEYTLDITLDDLGQDTKFINIETVPATIISLIDQTAYQTIFDTHFSGLVYNLEDRTDEEEHLITRVEDSSILFTLDDANTNKDIVTIEKAAEFEEERNRIKEEEERAEEERRATNPTEDDIEELYAYSCASCHGADLSGGGMFPQLSNIGSSLSEEQIYDVIVNGQGSMPAGLVDDNEAQHLAKWLSDKK